MNKKTKEMRLEDRFKKLQKEIVLVFTAIILVVMIFLVTVILESSNAIIREQVSSLTASNSKQLQLNINSYLENVETTAALLFADETYYKYDATDDTLDEYAKLKREETILERIVDLGLMENFADFGIVYANDHSVGWISHSTEDMFPNEGMYETFSGCITNEATNDGWVFGLEGNTDRMFYVKRLNENAVLITSFYNRELSSAFKYTQELQDMTVRLVDEEERILFSSDQDEIGELLPSEIADRLQDQSSITVMDDDYLINSDVCENGWRVICSISTPVLLQANIRLRNYTVLFSAFLFLVFITIGLLMLHRITGSMGGMVSTLKVKSDIDQLSGLLNKISFQENVTKRIALHDPNRYFAFVMLDADNFKQINDRLGHACGDQVIVRISRLLKFLFNENILVGRIGGDEFAIYMEFCQLSEKSVMEIVRHELESIFQAYKLEFRAEHEKCGLSLSAGVCVHKDEEQISFQSLYRQTDAALYKSKRNGKNCYTLYQEGMENEAVQ